MKKLVVYDSYFGNTEKIAVAISNSLGDGESGAIKVNNIKSEHMDGIEILVVGSPTRAFNATKAINDFLKNLPQDSLRGVKVAAFDTRVNPKDVNSKILNFFVKIFGYAAKPMGNKLKKKGGNLIVEAEGFFVKGSEGPLKDGEIERAENWAKSILNS
jgi:flavodoxin